MAKPYDPRDFYFRQAKKQGLRARSAFKIEEILRRHHLLGRGDSALDLGAAPGGFLQVLAEEVGPGGVVVGVDLEPIRSLGRPWVRTAVVDLLAPDALERLRTLHAGRFRLVTSDMAPKTIGVKVTDEARSLELVRMALHVAEETLAHGGALVAKVFMGGDFPALRKEFAERFTEVHVVRPEATREHSYEVYVVGKGFRGVGPSTGTGRTDRQDPESPSRPASTSSGRTDRARPPAAPSSPPAARKRGDPLK